MFTLARRTLLDLERRRIAASTVLAAARALDDACVALCEGQYLDLSFESRESVSIDEYLAMVRGKSAALISAACAIGALVAGANERHVHGYADFGQSLGLAFQIQDDVLGVWGDSARTGKPSGDDLRARKKSFPVVHAMTHLAGDDREEFMRRYAHPDDGDVEALTGLLESAGSREASTAAARSHASAALEAISSFEMEPERREDLETLARFAVTRDA
jgi:geranylgeranyl diphosphate synthase type I